jgi:flagellin-like protein
VPRGLSPVVGSLLLVALTVGLAATVGTVALQTDTADPPPRVRLSAAADAATDRITVTHEGGDSVAVDRLRMRVTVAGDPLAHQPPVPFFAASGFHSGPTGPFNTATDGEWVAGQTAGLRLASTNDPLLDPGDPVTVVLYHGDYRIASLETTA